MEIENTISVSNTSWMPAFVFKNAEGNVDAGMRTLFMQEMINSGVLFQGVFVPCYTHDDMELDFFINAFELNSSNFLSLSYSDMLLNKDS